MTMQFASSQVANAIAARQRTVTAPPVISVPPPSEGSASQVLKGVEETQRRSVAALKAMVELLIEKGVFSRDEYLTRVKR